jgi:hypothetical protein
MGYEFSCKNCGAKDFKTLTKPETLDEYMGAICTHCGMTVTEDVIEAERINLTEKFRREGFDAFWKNLNK